MYTYYWMCAVMACWEFWLETIASPAKDAEVYDFAEEREKRRMIV